MLSTVILTKNEEGNIKNVIESVGFTEEIIVIDDYSQDKTVDLAQKLGAKVLKRNLSKDFASQRNHGLNQAQGEWILFVDADERVTEQLSLEIKKLLDNIISSAN